jgi:heme/copper-type cytochrome/quinol oxidase subunit 2
VSGGGGVKITLTQRHCATQAARLPQAFPLSQTTPVGYRQQSESAQAMKNTRRYAQAIPIAYILIFVAVIICVGTFGIKLLMAKQAAKQSGNPLPPMSPTDLWTIGSAVVVLVVGMYAMSRYLSGDTFPSRYTPDISLNDLLQFERNVQRNEQLLADLGKQDNSALVGELHQRIKNEVTEEFLKEIRAKIAERDGALEWEQHFGQTADRIQAEISAQGRRGNLNLILGMVTALSGIVLLAFVVLGGSQSHTNATDFLFTFLPRVSIVAIIEVFAYFFLRLYKGSLSETKYFQNEATNLEVRFAALRIALNSKDATLLNTVVSQLMATDRNPVLENGKTTLELEKEKLDLNTVSISLPHVLAMMKEVFAKDKQKKSGEN